MDWKLVSNSRRPRPGPRPRFTPCGSTGQSTFLGKWDERKGLWGPFHLWNPTTVRFNFLICHTDTIMPSAVQSAQRSKWPCRCFAEWDYHFHRLAVAGVQGYLWKSHCNICTRFGSDACAAGQAVWNYFIFFTLVIRDKHSSTAVP